MNASSKSYGKKCLFPCLDFVGASWDREQKQIVGSIPLRINLTCISGLQIRKMKESFNIRVSVFDIAFRQFIGRTCNCPMVQIDEDKETKFDQSIYMHTSFNDINIILCFEVILTSKDTTNRRKSQSSLGWGLIPVFTATDGVRITALDVTRTSAVYKGTPRALLYMEEPIESNSYLQKIPGCQVTYTLQIHKPLMKVVHCLPVNILFAGSDAIPGVMEQPNSSTSYGGDLLKRPRPQKSVLLVLDHLVVNFSPDVENFEEEVCRNLDIDRLRTHNFSLAADNSHVAIVERRLKIGVHNGYTYLREPQLVHLVLQNNSGKDSKNRDVTKWILSHQNKIKLPEMTEDVHLMVVFLLEYIISTPVAVTDRKLSSSMALTRSQTSTVVVRWACWKPFLSLDTPDVTVTLIGGVSQNPDRVLVFAPISGDGELKFTFVIRKRRDSSSSEQMVTGLPKITDSSGPSSLPLSLSGHLPPKSPRRRTSNQQSHRRSHSDGSRKNSFYASVQSSEKTTTADNGLDNSASQDVVQIPCVTGPYVPITQVSSHLHSSGHSLSRAGYARLYGAGIPTILDRNGKPPDVVNLSEMADYFSVNREMSDPLKTNVIIFQFLAYSCHVTPGSNQAWSVPKILKFSFQFFRFPATVTDRMLVSHMEIDISSDPKYIPCLLQKVTEDGSVKKGNVGYEVKFCVDKNYFIVEKEREVFVTYLLNQCLHIDVWDGESQLYIGSASAELKNLCRQGKEAVQVTYELDVRFDDFCDEVPSSRVITRGYLHLRMANIGYPNTTEKLQFFKNNGMLKQNLDNKIDYKNIAQARSYLELDKKLAAEVSFSQKDPVIDEKVSRKIARMEAVRASRLNKCPAESRCYIDPNKERLRKIKAVKLVESARERNKHDIITGLLFEAFGKEVNINTVAGQAELFEFELVNPWKSPQTVTIECENVQELRVVTDHKEWLHFKSFHHKTKSTVEENMFVTGNNGGSPQMFIGSRERVCIPFRYQSTLFESPSSSSYNNLTGNVTSQQKEHHLQKVIFRTTEGKIMSVLLVRVDFKPPTVDRIFQFHCAERSFVKRSLRIPSTEISGNVSVLSSDQHVICEVTNSQHGNPIDILFKVSSGPCCTSKRFYLFIYADRFQITPLLSWLIVIHSLQKVDISCIQNERQQQSLILRGSHSTRLVKCFSSHPTELVLSPSDPFLLAASTIHELQLTLNVKIAGTRYMYINVVDVEFHQLVHAWLVCVVCKLPALTRAFQIQLPLGGGKGSNKRLPFTNPYVTRKKFFLHTSHPDLLHFKESCFEVAPKQSYTLGLIFLPNFTAGQIDILVFIHGEDDRNEETFCIKANYA